MLQAGTSRVRFPMRYLIFELTYSFQPLYCPGSIQPLTEMSTRNLPLAVKGGRRVGLTTSPPAVSGLSRENVGASTPHNAMGLHGLRQG
jgi:hypothetical protein